MKYEDITQLNNEQIAESCEDAADLLEGRWIQGNWNGRDEDAPEESYTYCVEGALAAALGLDPIFDVEDYGRDALIRCPVYYAVLKTLNQQIREQLVDSGVSEADAPREFYGEGDLPNWNDSEGRSEQEVVDLLRKTAKRVLGVEG